MNERCIFLDALEIAVDTLSTSDHALFATFFDRYVSDAKVKVTPENRERALDLWARLGLLMIESGPVSESSESMVLHDDPVAQDLAKLLQGQLVRLLTLRFPEWDLFVMLDRPGERPHVMGTIEPQRVAELIFTLASEAGRRREDD